MRLLWISDSPDSPSGFGMVTRAICPRLVRQGHEIEILGWQHRGAAAYWEGIPIRPVRHDTFGADVLHGYLMRFQPQIVITLADIWWMSFMADPAIQRYLDQARARWLLYFPVDGATPAGELPAGWRNLLEVADIPVAMSRFGQEVAAACGVPVDYVPHGCEIEVFRPPRDRDEAKRRLGYEGRFLVLSDARNQPRKLLPRLLDIAGCVCRKHPSVAFHLHSDPDDSASRSELYNYRLREDIKLLGLEERVGLTAGHQMRRGAGLSLEQLASLYQAADCHLLTSWGEGFGLPTLQAASCGTVPIAVDYSANRELLGDHGLPVPAESTLIDEFGIERRLIDREAAADAIASLIADSDGLAERSRRGREFALGYDWDRLGKRWAEVIESAPARRLPTRGYRFDLGAASGTVPESEVPEPVTEATNEVISRLPEGARASFRLSEHQLGAAEAAIRADSFREGDYVSMPVRLPPAFEGLPRATLGHLLVAPADLKLIPPLRRIFPGIAVSLPTPPENPIEGRMLEIEELVPVLPHYVVVVDYQGQAAAGLDVVCAILGVPFVGPSQIWPPLQGSRLAQLRQLLTDQGLSGARRSAALAALGEMLDAGAIERVRSLCLAGQPEPVQRAPGDEAPEIETVIIRLTEGLDEADRQAVISATKAGGGVLMMASARSLIAAIPVEAKESLEQHPGVELVGGVSLDEESTGAQALKESFAKFAAGQLAESLAPGGESR